MEYLSVSALNKYIKYRFDSDKNLNTVFLKGEISNFKRHQNGYIYFTLKDDSSQISAVIFKLNNEIDFELKDGLLVLVEGKVSVYEGYGKYQINISNIKIDGIGNLYLEFEKLKKKLFEKGYFDSKYKKEIPKMPKKIGVITSPTGAVIKDIINVVKRRYPICEILLYPANVQGEYAKNELINSIKKANDDFLVDVLILARGGGSLEDLWVFNNEELALEIFNSKIPIISAIGHETDFTISDFIADLRAPTPSAAAELITPNIKDLYNYLIDVKNTVNFNISNIIENKNNDLNKLIIKAKSLNVFNRINLYTERYNNIFDMLKRNMNDYMNYKYESFNYLNKMVNKIDLNESINNNYDILNRINEKMDNNLFLIINNKNELFNTSIIKLEALNPLNVMKRGYSVIKKNDKVIKSKNDLKKDDIIDINLSDGFVKGRII